MAMAGVSSLHVVQVFDPKRSFLFLATFFLSLLLLLFTLNLLLLHYFVVMSFLSDTDEDRPSSPSYVGSENLKKFYSSDPE